jgi:hypothetical protein
MAEEAKIPDQDSVTRTNTEIESRGTEAPRRPAPPEDTPRTNTEIESRDADRKEVDRPSEDPDPPRG